MSDSFESSDNLDSERKESDGLNRSSDSENKANQRDLEDR